MAGRAIWEPSDKLTVDAKLRFGQVDASSIAFNSVFQIPSLVARPRVHFGESPEMAAFGNEDVNGHEFQFDNNIVPFNNQDSFEGSVKVDYDLGWADLTGWGLYSDIQNELGADGTSGAFGFFFTEQQCIDTTNALGFYPVAPPQLIVPQDAFGPGTGGPAAPSSAPTRRPPATAPSTRSGTRRTTPSKCAWPPRATSGCAGWVASTT